MPFPDEVAPVRVVPYRDEWAADFERLAAELEPVLAAIGGEIEHVGSTSVPGLAAKDVIDAMVLVDALDREPVIAAFTAIGFRHRPESWNNLEVTFGVENPKLVFAPPIGARAVNVHVRVRGSVSARAAARFRDLLRADPIARDAWGDFKVRLASAVDEIGLEAYGQLKQPAWTAMMRALDADL